MTHLRALLRQPEIIVGTWMAAKAEDPDLTEADVREALARLEPLWDELFPAEQQRITRLLIERVQLHGHGLDIVWREDGWIGFGADIGAHPLVEESSEQAEALA